MSLPKTLHSKHSLRKYFLLPNLQLVELDNGVLSDRFPSGEPHSSPAPYRRDHWTVLPYH